MMAPTPAADAVSPERVSPKDPVSRAKGYIPTLDGWRALAILAVILYHGREATFRGWGRIRSVLAHGDLGVDVFFAISGFLICSRLLQEMQMTGSLNLRKFYVRRAFRILPPYLALIGAVASLAALSWIPIRHYEIPSCLFFVRDYFPLDNRPYGRRYTSHFWSLAVEEHFYLFWPLLLATLKTRRATIAAISLTIAISAWRLIDLHFHLLSATFPGTTVDGRTDGRLDGLLCGCLAALYYVHLKRVMSSRVWSLAWIPLLLTLYVIVKLHVFDPHLYIILLFPVMILTTVIHPESLFSRFLELPALRWIGTLSYSLYLWQSLFMQPEALPGSREALSGFWRLQQFPWNYVAVLVTASASYYLLERPMIRVGHHLARPVTNGRPELQDSGAYPIVPVSPIIPVSPIVTNVQQSA